jgi:hypothetical protein
MTKVEQRNQKAFTKAVEEIEKDKVNEIKALVKDALERIHKAEAKRRDAVAEIQVLKRDLDDLRKGRVDKIKERHEKDKKADTFSPITPSKLDRMLWINAQGQRFPDGTEYATTTGYMVPTKTTNVSLGFGANVFLSNAASGTYTLNDGTVKSL